jgi:coenzyme F420-reducing hydrogenase alpha subunit
MRWQKVRNSNLSLDVHHVTRVEGHGNIIVNVKDGNVETVRWDVPESPRFFEAMLIGRRWDEAHHITSRICGICSIGHTLTSIRATEAAFRIEPSEQTVLLRKLALHGENLQSHVLHTYFLVAPDLLGVPSVIPLVASHPDVVLRALRLKKLSNDMCDLIAGRTTHPISLVPGGMAKVPTAGQLKDLRKSLVASLDDLSITADLFATLKFPDFSRETEYIALTHKNEYALYDGVIASSDGGTWPASDYLGIVNEFCVPHSTAKHTRHKRDSYAVGALARFNINARQLAPTAAKVARKLGLKPVNYNPFMNSVAQLIESVHSVEDSIKIIDTLLERGIRQEPCEVTPVAGRGVGAVEVPRGILFHDYTYDKDGLMLKANCVIPTNQNHRNIQHDMEKLVAELLDKPKHEIELTLEMLVRSYDPCISCSTHLLKVNFL